MPPLSEAPSVYEPSAMDELEDFTKSTTDSKDPLENFDIVVESLVTDHKNKSSSRT